MPELPEVETIRRDLNHFLRGKKIKAVEVKLAKIVKPSPPAFQKLLIGQQIEEVSRRAKLVIFRLSGGFFILTHLKMSGQMIFDDGQKVLAKGGHPIKDGDKDLPNQYTHVIFEFADGSHLLYNDLRQFGWLKIVDQQTLQEELVKYGPEPLEPAFTREVFVKLLEKNSRPKIKPFLMKQEKIAGIGNIYADEICFFGKVRPERVIKTLTIKERKDLFLGIKHILEQAIAKRGTSADQYVDARGQQGGYLPYLKVYGRAGQKCKRCAGIIKKIKLAGRGTHFCPQCQR